MLRNSWRCSQTESIPSLVKYFLKVIAAISRILFERCISQLRKLDRYAG